MIVTVRYMHCQLCCNQYIYTAPASIACTSTKYSRTVLPGTTVLFDYYCYCYCYCYCSCSNRRLQERDCPALSGTLCVALYSSQSPVTPVTHERRSCTYYRACTAQANVQRSLAAPIPRHRGGSWVYATSAPRIRRARNAQWLARPRP